MPDLGELLRQPQQHFVLPVTTHRRSTTEQVPATDIGNDVVRQVCILGRIFKDVAEGAEHDFLVGDRSWDTPG